MRWVRNIFLESLVLMCCAGCTLSRWNKNVWLGDFEAAERDAVASNGALVILYIAERPEMPSPLQEAFMNVKPEALGDDQVRCVLSRSYAPDRRFVAQYGVERAPGLIVIHCDGTYHARTGPMSVDDMHAFIAAAAPPGAQPRLNPHLARRPSYDWIDSIDAGTGQARETNQPMLVVYYRRLSGDWSTLNKMLCRHEVCSRLAGMVHCRVATLGIGQKTAETPYGVLRLPALVIATPAGRHEVLELPGSYEDVAMFAGRALGDGDTVPSTAERASSVLAAPTSSP